jgi:hypothetical protein
MRFNVGKIERLARSLNSEWNCSSILYCLVAERTWFLRMH